MMKIKYGLILSGVLLAGCSSTGGNVAQSKSPSLDDAQIKTLLVGKVAMGEAYGVDWTADIKPDGSVYASGSGENETGTYTIQNGKFCTSFNSLLDGGKNCWTISNKGNGQYAKHISGSARSSNFIVN